MWAKNHLREKTMGKMRTALIAGAVVAGFYLPASLAQSPEDGHGRMEQHGMKDMMKENHMSHMDQDADGKISKDEFIQAHEDMFKKMDQDGDGKLDEEEMRRGMDMMRDRMR